MCWRVAHGLAAVENCAEPDPYECPAMSSTFERRMVTPHMKVQYSRKDGVRHEETADGARADSGGTATAHVAVRAAPGAQLQPRPRPCGLRYRYTVTMQRSNAPALCPRCK